jgi:hypothetical protein
MTANNKIFFLLFCLITGIYGCQCNQPKDPHQEIKITQPNLKLESIRLDSLIFHTPFENIEQFKSSLEKQSQQSICTFVEDIVRMGPCQDSTTFHQLHAFSIFKDMVDLQKAIETSYDTEGILKLNEALSKAFQKWISILPQEIAPELIWMNGSLASASYAKENRLFIGLDSYLYPHAIVKEFPSDRFPLYKRKNMQSQYIVPNALFNWISYRYDHYDTIPPTKNDFLTSLIYSGKIMYATDLLLAETPDSVKMMWTPQEMEWAIDHEFQIWKEIAQQNVMFGTKKEDIHKWFNEAPHTLVGNIPTDSPAQLGIWMGWRIVKSYMIKNEKVTLEELFKEQNNQKILSAYKPTLP